MKEEKFEIKDYYENVRKPSPMKIELFDPNLTRNDSIRYDEKGSSPLPLQSSTQESNEKIVEPESAKTNSRNNVQAEKTVQEVQNDEEEKKEQSSANESKGSLNAAEAKEN